MVNKYLEKIAASIKGRKALKTGIDLYQASSNKKKKKKKQPPVRKWSRVNKGDI